MLNEDQIQKLRMTFTTAGWNDVIKPVIANRAREAIKALIVRPSERVGEYKDIHDEDLRAIIREGEWLLTVFDKEIEVFEHNRRLEELQATRNGEIATPANP